MSPRDSDHVDAMTEADRQLMRAVAAGSSDALGRLYDRHASVAFGLARRILTRVEDAEEVVQDVFAQVWRDAGRYLPERASVAGWIVMLTRTRAIDRLRARRSRPDQAHGSDPDSVTPLAAVGPDPEQVAVSEDDGRQVRRALEGLPPEQRALVDLAYFEGLTQSEIAERTGVPLGTVKTRVRAAMAKLRSVLAS